MDALYERRERLADEVRQYVAERAEPWTGGYLELTDEVYLDPRSEELIDAGSVEIATDGATEESAIAYLREAGQLHESGLRTRLREDMYMRMDIDRALTSLREKDNITYRGGRYRLDEDPEPASDGQVLRLLDHDIDAMLEP